MRVQNDLGGSEGSKRIQKDPEGSGRVSEGPRGSLRVLEGPEDINGC